MGFQGLPLFVALSAHKIENSQKGSGIPKTEIEGECRGSIKDRRQPDTNPGGDRLNKREEIKKQLNTNQ
jgi:hypothetical protein